MESTPAHSATFPCSSKTHLSFNAAAEVIGFAAGSTVNSKYLANMTSSKPRKHRIYLDDGKQDSYE